MLLCGKLARVFNGPQCSKSDGRCRNHVHHKLHLAYCKRGKLCVKDGRTEKAQLSRFPYGKRENVHGHWKSNKVPT